MHTKIIQRYIGFLFLSAIAFQSCKKDSGSSSDPGSSEFYLTAKIDGKPWAANLKNGENNVAAGSSNGLYLVLGVQIAGKDSTAMIVAFPTNVVLNTTHTLDPLQKSIAGYVSNLNSYTADPVEGGSGNYEITNIIDSTKIIEGTFSFTGARTQGSGELSVKVTDGKFRTKYTTNSTPQPPDNLKR